MPTGLKWVLVFLVVFGVGFGSGYKARDYKLLQQTVVANKADQEDQKKNLEVAKTTNEGIQKAEDTHNANSESFKETDNSFDNRIIQLGYDGLRYSEAESRATQAESAAALSQHQLDVEKAKVARLSKELRRVTQDYRKESLRANQVVNDFNQCSDTINQLEIFYNNLR